MGHFPSSPCGSASFAAASPTTAFIDASGEVRFPWSELTLCRCWRMLVISTSPLQTVGSGAKKTCFNRCYIMYATLFGIRFWTSLLPEFFLGKFIASSRTVLNVFGWSWLYIWWSFLFWIAFWFGGFLLMSHYYKLKFLKCSVAPEYTPSILSWDFMDIIYLVSAWRLLFIFRN